MKHILSISLGSSTRDKSVEVEILGERFLLERRGTDGDLRRFGRFLQENDGHVDCLCIGGTNLGLHWGGRFYPFREIQSVVRDIHQTPVVDGAGLKDTLERETISILQQRGVVDFAQCNTLVVCATDRFGLTEAVTKLSRKYILGDLMFNLGLPIPLRSTRSLDILAALLLPVLTKLPFRWLYPTGSQQDEIVPKWQRYYEWADVIAGDFLVIRRHLPNQLTDKIIITNTTTEEDVELLTARGLRLLITTTPVIEGRSFATNVMEGVFVSLIDKPLEQITPKEYMRLARQMDWSPVIRELNPASSPSS